MSFCLFSVRNATPYPHELVSNNPRGRKRPSEGAFGGAPKKTGRGGPPSSDNTEGIMSDEQLRRLVAAGRLETLTVPQLKAQLSNRNLRVGGHKAELVARIKAFLNG